MAEQYDERGQTPTPKQQTKADTELLATARTRLKAAMEAMDESREDELDDLKFRAASPDNHWQWPADVLATRGAVTGQSINARPTLTINKLPQHVLQVTNDQKQNRPAGRVIPVDDRADIAVAEIYEGMVRHIEYISDADVAYDTACDNQVTYGEGYFRILTEYCDENSFEQDIKIGRIRNSFSVYMDPMMQDPCGSDAQWCFITQDMTHEEYEQEFPKAMPVSSLQHGIGDEGVAGWLSTKSVRIAEYFYYENEEKTLCLMQTPDGQQFPVIKGGKDHDGLVALGATSIKERSTVLKQVKWCKTNGYEVLEKRDWAGKWIPVIRVIGNEFEIDGQIHVSGIVRNAKDAQRMYNYWVSQEAEMLALAPKAPFVGYAGQFEGYEQQWKTANIQNWPYLEVNPDAADPDGKPYPLPQRTQPPMMQSGIINAKMGAADDIKATTGQYDPSLGQRSNETSGRAILAREQQADTGTYHYVDNLARAIRYGARQIVDLIPKIYDTKRVARIVGLDGETDHIEIDPSLPQPVQEIRDPATNALIKKIYNPKIGRYDVAVTTGPSYMTKRQQTSDVMVQLSQGATDPNVALLMRYFAIKNMDFPESQEFVNALKKMLPPGVLDDDEDTPEVAKLKQVIEQRDQQLQQMQKAIEEYMASQEAAKVENDTFKVDIQAYDAMTKRLAALDQIVQNQITPSQVEEMVMNVMKQIIPDVQPVQEMGIPEMPMMAEMGGMGGPMGGVPQ